MHRLVDVHRLEWNDAWQLCTGIFSYTNHTLMPEALETWPVVMMRSVLPRHLDIILEINRRFLDWVRRIHGDDPDLRGASPIDETGERRVYGLPVGGKSQGKMFPNCTASCWQMICRLAKLYPQRFCK
jgi:starch phosphorylase